MFGSAPVVTTAASTCTAPSGKEFSGWLCGSKNVNAGSTFTISADTTCTAQYVSYYNVTYSCGDGSGTAPTDSNGSYVSGSSVTTASNSCTAPSGKEFSGWLCGSTGVGAGGTFTISSDTTCTAQYADYSFSVTTTSISSGGTFEFSLSAKGTFYVDCGNGGTLSSDDATANAMISGGTITKNNTTNYNFKCTYSSAGAKTIQFGGEATEYNSASGDNVVAAISFYKSSGGTQSKIASISGSLGAVFPTIGNGSDANQQPRFRSTFQGATNLASVPADLFSGVTGSADGMFRSTFDRCSKITVIPDELFADATGGAPNMFRSTFYNCTGLTSMPEELFSGITDSADSEFKYTFYGCTNLAGYIPPSTFAGLIANHSPTTTNMWNGAFDSTQLLTECPSDTVQYITRYEGNNASTTWNGKVSCESAKYTVTYSCGTGEGTQPTDSNEYSPGTSVTTLSNTCTAPSGKEFSGWLCDSTNVNVGGTFTISADTTCTAQYADLYSVTYSCGDGSGNAPTDSAYYATGNSVTTLSNTCTAPSGKEFSGWLCDSTNVNVGGTFTISADTTCTAQYADLYSVTYSCGTGQGTPPTDSNNPYVGGSSVTTAANSCTSSSDKEFSGWLCGSTNVNAGGTFTISSDTTCTAQYADLYSVTYSCGDGSGNAPTDSSYYSTGNSVITLSNTCTAPSGKEFSGWLCDSTNVNVGGTFTISADTTCTAQYADLYSVTYSCGDGSGNAPTDSAYYATGNSVTTLSNTCTPQSGYDFSNWLCGSTNVNVGGTFTISSNTTCVAQYVDVHTTCAINGNINSGYTRVEYLENSGVAPDGQFINTEYEIASSNLRIEAGFGTAVTKDDTNTEYGNLFGNQKANKKGFSSSYKNGQLGLWHSSNSKKLAINFRPMTADIQYDLFYVINGTSRSVTVNSNGTQLYSGSDTNAGTTINNNNLFIFSNGASSTNNGTITLNDGDKLFERGRVYYFKLLDDSTLQLDLIPVRRNSDNELGMCNRVNGKFLANVGTGTFNAGPSIYNVKYSCGTGSGTAPTDSNDYSTNDSVTTAANSCTAPSGKVFIGWLCGSMNVNASSTFTITSNTTCTAQYVNLYTVTYSCGTGGGTAPSDSNHYSNGDTVTTMANTCTVQAGTEFNNWLCGSTNVNAGSTFTINASTTCTAQWTQNTINVSWYDGDTLISDDISCSYGGDLDLPTPPTKTGYTFLGWKLRTQQ
jgi:hypothetical protein